MNTRFSLVYCYLLVEYLNSDDWFLSRCCDVNGLGRNSMRVQAGRFAVRQPFGECSCRRFQISDRTLLSCQKFLNHDDCMVVRRHYFAHVFWILVEVRSRPPRALVRGRLQRRWKFDVYLQGKYDYRDSCGRTILLGCNILLPADGGRAHFQTAIFVRQVFLAFDVVSQGSQVRIASFPIE